MLTLQRGWSLCGGTWDELLQTLHLLNLDWKNYSLYRANKPLISRSSGIYMICSSTESISTKGGMNMPPFYNVLYVGISKNLQNRFYNHSTDPTFARARSIFREVDFWFATCSQEYLEHLEQQLIDAFGPTLNKRNSTRRHEPVTATINQDAPIGA